MWQLVDSIVGAARDARVHGLMEDRLSGWLLPPRCMLCGDRGQPPCLDLCAACERTLPASAQSIQQLPGQLGPCLAPFSYDYPLAYLLQGLKYSGRLAIGRVLGMLLAEQIAAAGLHRDVEVLLPVPLHPARHAVRGYNQSTEIARWISRRLNRPLETRLASRRVDTPPQVGLGIEQRRSNLRGAFAVSAAVRGRHLTLIDDVTTTGSTLGELASALLDAGAAGISAWCVARAERRGVPAVACAEPSPGRSAMR
jgi:ComF family protein